MKAYINHGRWVVDCHFCNGAELAPPGTVLTSCYSCKTNIEVEHPADYIEIERILMQRTEVENRNWVLGETLVDLQRENVEHGVIN